MNFQEIYDTVKFISLYSGYPAVLFYLVFMREKKGNIRIAFYVLLASFLADVIGKILSKYIYNFSVTASNIWVIANYVILAWLYCKLTPRYKQGIYFASSFFLILSIISVDYFNSFNRGIETFLAITCYTFSVLSILAFYEIKKHQPVKNLLTYPVFWINAGILIYFSAVLIKFSMMPYFYYEVRITKSQNMPMHFFNNLTNPTKNLFFLLAFYFAWKGYPDYIFAFQKQRKTVD